MTDFTNVRITIDTELTNYNGRALGKEEEARLFWREDRGIDQGQGDRKPDEGRQQQEHI